MPCAYDELRCVGLSSVARETVSFTLCNMGRPRTASEAANAVLAVRFTPELKAGIERLVAHQRTMLAAHGLSGSVTESDVLRGLVAKAVRELDELQAQPPTPAPQLSLPSALAASTPTPKAPRAVKPKASAGSHKGPAIVSADELPPSWDEERRGAHRKLSEFFAAHPDAIAVKVAKALLGEKDTAVFYKFLAGKKTLSTEYCRSLDAVLASFST